MTTKDWLFRRYLPLKKAIAVLLMLCAQSSYSYDDKGPWTYVSQMYVVHSNSVFVSFEEGGAPGCFGNNSAYIPQDNVDGADKLYSTLLAALTAKRKVRAYYNYTSANQDGWSRCTLEAVYIQ